MRKKSTYKAEPVIDLGIRQDAFLPYFKKLQSIEQTKTTYRNLNQFLGEIGIKFVYREIVGYYAIDKETYTIYGMEPANEHEFLIFILFTSLLIFDSPTLERAITFMQLMAKYYYIKQGIVVNVTLKLHKLRNFLEQKDSKKYR